jgi:Tol biopolymer transport system component
LLRYNGEQRAFELTDIGTGDVRRLTTEGPDPADGVVAGSELSVDRRRLAAIVEFRKPRPNGPAVLERTELRVFEGGGRGPGRVLARWDAQVLSVQPFAWSPRSDRIWLFVMRSDSSAQIASVELSGTLQVLKTLTWRDHAQPPSLSPDGRFVAYHDATSRETRPDLYILATDGSVEHRVEHPADDSKPIFVPDGSGVVFASDRRGTRDLWFLEVKAGRPAGEPRLVWRNIGPFGLVQRFTDSGSLLFYFAVNDVGIYTVPLDLKAASPIGEPTRLAPLVNEPNSDAAFSPDGRYLSHFRANATRIVLRELATGLEREIPFGAPLRPGYATADWCPSADTLIATGNIQGTGWVAYRVDVKDSSAKRLPISLPPKSPFFPALCASDGEEIIYVPISYPPGAPAAAPPSIIRRSLATGRETTLFTGAVHMLARSVDGRRLAFVTIDPNADVARLVTMSAAGGDVSADLMTSGTYPYQGGRAPLIRDVVWMPSGDRLLVAVGESVDNQPHLSLWEVPLTGAAPRKLGPLPLPKKELFPGATRLAVHPDGKRFAFQSREGFVRQTWAIDNLFQSIKAANGK